MVVEPMENLRSVSVGVFVATGSLKEGEKESGISHCIEHMLFKGTQKRSARQIAQEMDEIGAQMNAFTGRDCTCFYIKCAAENLPEAIDLLSDMLQHSLLLADELRREQGVIVEEIHMVEDAPEDYVFELFQTAAFEGYPLASPILGTVESVQSFASDDLKTYMAEHYSLDNIVISAAGAVETEDFFSRCEDAFSQLPASGAGKKFPAAPPRFTKRILCEGRDVEQVQIALGLPGYGSRDPHYSTLALLCNAFGGYMSSRLFQRIREESGLAYTVYSYLQPYLGMGYMGLYAACGKTQAEKVLQQMQEEIQILRRDGLSEEELVRSRRQIEGSLILGGESSGSRMQKNGKQLLLFGSIRPEQETIALLRAVDQQSIRNILGDVLDETALCGALLGPNQSELESLATII